MDKEFYTTLLDNTLIGYACQRILYNSAGEAEDYEFVEVNEALANLLQIPASAAVGGRVSKVLPALWKSMQKLSWRPGCSHQIVYEKNDFAYNVNVIYVGEDCLMALFADITECRSRQLELEHFFSINLDLLCIADTEGRFIKVNKAWESILGYTAAELQRQKFLSYVHPDDVPATLRTMSALSRQQPVINFINRYRSKDGSWRFIEWRSQPYGQLIYAAARDITEKVEFEARLEEKAKNFRMFFESLEDIVVVATPQRRIVYSNAAGLEKLEYPESEMREMTLGQLYDDAYRGQAEKMFTEILNQRAEHCLLPLRSRQGTALAVESKLWSGQWNGQECIYMVAKDLSQQQAAINKFYKIFNHNPALMAVSLWQERRLVDVNQAFLTKLGYQREEVIGKAWDELALFLQPCQQQMVADFIKMSGHIPSCEVQVCSKEGEVLTGLLSGEFIEDQQQKLLLTVITDMTAQKQVEQELRSIEVSLAEEKRRLADVLHGARVGTWEWDIGNGIVVVNERWAEIVGYSLAELTPLPVERWLQFIHPDDLSGSAERLQQHFAGKADYYEYEMRIKHREGHWCWVLDRGYVAVWDENIQPLLMSGTHQDITRQKQAEAQMHQSNERLKLATRAAQVGIWEYDLVAGTLLWDEAMYELYGITEKDFSGAYEAWERGLHPDDLEASRRHLQDAVSGVREFNPEFRVVWPNGTIRHIKANGTVMRNNSGKALKVIGTNWDVTKRRQHELALMKAKEQAESANIMKSRFLANMSHEIRTPMNGIVGYLELLKRSQLDRQQQEYVSEAKGATEVLLHLINDILDISRIEAGKLLMEKINFNIRKIIEEAMALLKPKIREKCLRVYTKVAPEVPEVMKGDPARLRQVINNLLNNAVKFTVKGEIGIVVDSRLQEDGRAHISFQIHDTGIGIAPEIIGKLFKPFVQADATTTRTFGGTGLGLAISKELIKRMDGDITVDSVPGQGSNFRFSVCLEVCRPEKNLRQEGSLTGVNILLADADASSRLLLKNRLAPSGCCLLEADSADKALTMILVNAHTAQKVGLAIIDYQLPGMDGCQLARALKMIPMAADIKLIMTAFRLTAAVQAKAQDAGFDNYLPKPIDGEGLFASIALALGLEHENCIIEPEIDLLTTPLAITGKKLQILLVEDNDMNRKIVVMILKLQEIDCDVANDGREALQLLAVKDYDLVFMDCQMPILDGYQATAAIRKMEGDRKHTPIIAMTAHAMDGDRDKCLAAGMDDYITKPIDLDTVLRIIDMYIKTAGN